MEVHSFTEYDGERYGKIAQSYDDVITRLYGSDTTVAFDGYEEGLSIKDNMLQRSGHNIHAVVSFTAETEFSGKNGKFRSRNVNKQWWT